MRVTPSMEKGAEEEWSKLREENERQAIHHASLALAFLTDFPQPWLEPARKRLAEAVAILSGASIKSE